MSHLVTGHEVCLIVLAMLGKAFISMSFGIIYVFSAELFPTVCRNAAVSAGSFWARVGGVMAPQIARLVSYCWGEAQFVNSLLFGI